MVTWPPEALRRIMVGLLGEFRAATNHVTACLSLTVTMALTPFLSSQGSTERVFKCLT